MQLRAFSIGRADSFELRRAALGLLLVALGVLATSHPFLLELLRAQSQSEQAPAAIVMALHSDLHRFVVGVLLLIWGIHGLWRVADDAQRTMRSRRIG